MTYALHPDYGLAVTAVARNHGVTPVPFGAGFHPYLSVHGHRLDDVTVQVPAKQHLVTDEAQLPVGVAPVSKTHYDLRRAHRLKTLRLDDTFTALSTVDGRGSVLVRTRSGGAQLWFDEAFGYLQVYTHEQLGDGAPAVAVEPMTCPADAFNSGAGLIVLDPAQVWTGTWGIAPLPR